MKIHRNCMLKGSESGERMLELLEKYHLKTRYVGLYLQINIPQDWEFHRLQAFIEECDAAAYGITA